MSAVHVDVVDRRAAFRARCVALADARADGGGARVAALLPLTSLDGASDSLGGANAAAPLAEPSRRPSDPAARERATARAAVIAAGASPTDARPDERLRADVRSFAPVPSSASAPPGPARLLIVPGLLGDSVRALVAPLASAREALAVAGRDVGVAWVNGRAGSTRNAARLRAVVLEAAAASGAPIDLVGYSKGCADALHMLGDWPDTHAALRSLVSLGGVVGGTPLAHETPPPLGRALARLPLPGRGRGDGRAVVDLTPAFRRSWLERNPLPGGIRYASIVATPSPERVSRVLKPSWRRLAAVDPRNDSQVIARDALLPGGELLATADADHWALALPIAERSPWLARLAVTRNDFPRQLVLEALMDHLAETSPATVGPV